MFGLRGKIALLSLFSFFFLAGLAIPAIYGRMAQQFATLETAQAEVALAQVVSNVRAELGRQNELASDWANWDALYAYAQSGDVRFASSEISSPALISAHVNLMAVFAADSTPRIVRALDLVKGVPVDAQRYDDVVAAIRHELRQDTASSNCGLYSANAGLLALCWQPIRRTERTGAYVGSLLMGRLITPAIIERMREQSGLDFELQPRPALRAVQRLDQPFTAGNVRLDTEQAGILLAELNGAHGGTVANVVLRFAQDISTQGQAVGRLVAGTMMLVMVLAGLVQFVGVHLLIVQPIQHLSRTLREIAQTQSWARRIPVDERQDEIATVRQDVNELLAVVSGKVQALEELSLIDELTRLPNRRAFERRLAEETRHWQRTARPLAVMLIDIDQFAHYNARYGTAAGDVALRKVAETLCQGACRPGDMAARIGGEEFGLILPDTSPEGAKALAERLHTLLASHCITHADTRTSTFLTISIGITNAANEEPMVIIGRAEAAMDDAKIHGRHGTAFRLIAG